MQQRSVIERVEILERKVESLERLPERVTAVELQLVQLRDEMRAEFSATRAEMRAGDEETRHLLRESEEETRHLLRESEEETRRLIRESEEETRRLLREGDEETRRYMRVLHEDVIARISMLEGPRRSRKKRDPEP
jgi:hypothetical protein